ncbi:HP1 family phage holin, partial [Pseudomonas marginalis]
MQEKYSSPFAYAWGVFTATIGAMSLDQWAVFIGILCT